MEDLQAFAGLGQHPCRGHAGLDYATRRLLANSLAPASQQAYRTGQTCYRRFCASFGLPETPATDATLAYFIGHMSRAGLSLSTAKMYLAAVRRLHLQHGFAMPPGLPPLAATALQGYQARGVPCGPLRPRLALTPDLLLRLKASLIAGPLCIWDQRCVWAAVTLAFFCGLRASDYLRSAPGRGLLRLDLYVSAARCSARLRLQKTRQHGAPQWVSAPATGTALCPVRSLGSYCAARDQHFPQNRPLFLLHDGGPLTPARLNQILREALGDGFSTHSLRIGIATAATAVGVDDATVQRLGRWRSSAFNGYVRGLRPDIERALLAVASAADLSSRDQ